MHALTIWKETHQGRFSTITEWKAARVDFQRNCVFIDEAGFNSRQIRSRDWSKIKKHIKRNPLSSLDTLTPGIQAAYMTVTTEDYSGWIRHSESFWDRFLNEELGLV